RNPAFLRRAAPVAQRPPPNASFPARRRHRYPRCGAVGFPFRLRATHLFPVPAHPAPTAAGSVHDRRARRRARLDSESAPVARSPFATRVQPGREWLGAAPTTHLPAVHQNLPSLMTIL